MATAFSSTHSSTVDIRDVITCVICKGKRSSPYIQLNCFHVCHKVCVRNARPGAHISCAKCRATTLVPKKGVEGFSEELLQYKMKEIAEICSNTSPACKLCEFSDEVNTSTHFCVTCKNYLCLVDTKRHQAFPDHKVITNDEVQTEQYLSQILTSKDAVCPVHNIAFPTEVIKFYCEECQIPVCQVCCITEHKQHKVIPIQQAGQRLKRELKTKATDVLQLKTNCEYVVDKLKKLLDDIEDDSKQQIAKCKKQGEGVKQIVDKIVNENVQTIENLFQIRKNEIGNITKEKNNIYQQLLGANDYMEVFLKFASGSDFLKRKKPFMGSLNKCLQNNTDVQITIENSKVKKNIFKEAERNLEQILELETEIRYLHISKPPEKQKQLTSCELELKWDTQYRSGLAVDGDNILAVGYKNIEVYGINGQKRGQVNCQRSGNAFDIEVVNKQLFISSDQYRRGIFVVDRKGEFQRKISLPVREYRAYMGKQGLAVDHTNKDIYIGSNTTHIVYKSSLGQTEAYPFITTGLNRPKYLCATLSNELIISDEGSHTVSKYNSDGKLMWKYGKKGTGEGELNEPQGICVDPWGHVFVCDSCNNCIHHLSPEGKFISFIEIGEAIVNPNVITFSNDKIIIANDSPLSKIFVIRCKYN